MIYRNVCAFLQLFLFLFICRHILGYDTRDRAEKRVPMHGTVDKVYSFVNVSEAWTSTVLDYHLGIVFEAELFLSSIEIFMNNFWGNLSNLRGAFYDPLCMESNFHEYLNFPPQ